MGQLNGKKYYIIFCEEILILRFRCMIRDVTRQSIF